MLNRKKNLGKFKRHIISCLKGIISEKFDRENKKFNNLIKEKELKRKGYGVISSILNDYRNGDTSIMEFIFCMVIISFPLIFLGISIFSFLINSFSSCVVFALFSIVTAVIEYFAFEKKTIAELNIDEYNVRKERIKKNRENKIRKTEDVFGSVECQDLDCFLNFEINVETLNEMSDVFSEEELKLLLGRLERSNITYRHVIGLIKSIENEDKTEMLYKSLFGFKKGKEFKLMKDEHYV